MFVVASLFLLPVIGIAVLFWTIIWGVAGGLMLERYPAKPPLAIVLPGWGLMVLSGVLLVRGFDRPDFTKLFGW